MQISKTITAKFNHGLKLNPTRVEYYIALDPFVEACTCTPTGDCIVTFHIDAEADITERCNKILRALTALHRML